MGTKCGVYSSKIRYPFSFLHFLIILSLTFLVFDPSTQALTMINKEQRDFLGWILQIPLIERSWKKLVMLDTLHAYCGGIVPMAEARRLDA